MKKILLINVNKEQIPYPVPPIGICLLAKALQNQYQVKIFDAVFETKEKFITNLIQFKPDFIGLSIRNIDNMHIHNPKIFTNSLYEDFIIPIKKHSSVPLILGGSGFSLFPAQLMRLLDADYGVVGEAEKILPALLKAIEEKENNRQHEKKISHIDRVLTRGQSDFSGKRQRSGDLKNFHFSEIDRQINFSPYLERGVYSIQTKRGCYHQCIYCTYPVIEGSHYRLRSVKSIVDEIEQVYQRLGKINFEFVDSTFNDPPGHAEAICREIIKRKININLRTMGINPAHSSSELFDLMLNAGFKQIDCTPDSASPFMIKQLRKNFTLKQLIKTAQLIRQYQLPTMWFFIFGGPGENEKTFYETIEFIDQWLERLDMAHMTAGLRIYPDTELQQIAVTEKRIKAAADLFKPIFYVSKELPLEQLCQLFEKVSKSRPNCIPATESTPPPEMLKAALGLRKRLKIEEPMFRTLLRLRYQYFERKII